MGIKRLNNFLSDKDVLKYHKNISDYIRSFKSDGYQFFNTRNEKFTVGVDLLLYAHKYKYSCDNIYDGFLNQILHFLSNRVIPVYIIDGVAPDEKNDIIEHRMNKRIKIDKKIKCLEDELIDLDDNKENSDEIISINNEILKLSKNNIKINSSDIDNLINLFNIFNIPYIRAKNEADTLISELYKKKIINACLSEDMDLLVFGCRKMIKFKTNLVVEYDLDYILKKLDLSNEEFIELCILFGCDYLKPLLRMKPDEIYTKYKNNNSIPQLFNNNYNINTVNKYLEDYRNVKNIFLNGNKNDNEKNNRIKLNLEHININKLYDFINDNNMTNYDGIGYHISHINDLIKNKKFGI